MLTSLEAQEPCNLNIRGKIIHLENNEPIEGAFIWLVEAEKGSISDALGNFRIQNVCSGTITLKVQYMGHKEYLEQISLNSNTNLTIRLVAEDIDLEGVDIHGHQDALLTSNAVSALYGNVLRESRGQNLGETLKRIPGVTSYASGPSIQKPVIHGLHSNRILILNNGVRLEGQQWGAEHAPEIDPFLAKEIAVVKGAESVRFGPDAMGGVILVNPAPLPVKAGFNGEVDLIGFSNGRGVNGAAYITGGSSKIAGLGYRFQTSSKISGNIQTPDYMLDNTGVREFNLSGAMGYSSSKLGTELYFSHFQTTIGILRDSHTGNLSDLEEIIENGRPFSDPDFTYDITNPKQEVGHQLFKAKIHYHLNDGAKLNLQYAFQRNHRQEFDRRRGDLNERPSLDMELFTNTLDFTYTHQTRKNWDGSIGLGLIQQANSNIQGTGVVPLIPNFDMLNIGAYLIEKFTSGPLEIEGGLRYDYRWIEAARILSGELQERSYQFNNFSAFLGGMYAFSRNWTFNSNLATAWRPPNINEQFSQGLHHGLAAIEIGDPDLESEKSYKWLNSLNYADSKLNIELTAYTNRINNYIYLNPVEEQLITIRGTFNVFEYLQTDAGFWGTDLSAVWEITDRWEFFNRSSLVRAVNLTENSYLPFIPADRMENGLSFQLKKERGKFNSKIFLSNLTVAQQTREPDFDFAPAPPSYSIWNLGIQSSIKTKGNTLNIGLQVQNLFDTEYKDYMNRFRYFTHEIGRNVFLKLNYEF
ncbi:TonB-dependent receptor [Shivajiella indica]|uniref:TonB-dependent receptor n=1 Tax=Shivajiella indica TaxID=872115 RepID=A0ABW5B8Z7_9BACT